MRANEPESPLSLHLLSTETKSADKNSDQARKAENPLKTRGSDRKCPPVTTDDRACHQVEKEMSPRGFEPLAFGSGNRRSIQLSYGDKLLVGNWLGQLKFADARCCCTTLLTVLASRANCFAMYISAFWQLYLAVCD